MRTPFLFKLDETVPDLKRERFEDTEMNNAEFIIVNIVFAKKAFVNHLYPHT